LQSMRKNGISAVLLFILFFVMSDYVVAEIKIFKFLPKKDTVLAGELVDMSVTYINDSPGEMSVLGVETWFGDIIPQDASEEMHAEFEDDDYMKIKLFYLAEGSSVGEVRFKYRTPDRCDYKLDFLDIYAIKLDKLENGNYIVISEKKIKSKPLTIKCGNFALLEYFYNSFHQSISGTVEENIDIHLRLNLAPTKAPGVYRIKQIKVEKAHGLIEVNSGNRLEKAQLISVETKNISPIIQMALAKNMTKITSVRFPLINVELSWKGAKTFVPPKSITVGPVTELDSNTQKKQEDALLRQAKRLKRELNPALSRLGQLQKYQEFTKFLQLMNPPDFTAKDGYYKSGFCEGGGESFKKIPDFGTITKRYKWKLYFKPQK